MKNNDFFDLTGLPFDPPEKMGKKVENAIKKKIKELQGLLINETQQEKRDKINEEIRLLEQTKTQVLSPDGKKVVESAMSALAEKRKDEEIIALTATASLMAATGKKTITKQGLREFRTESRLSEEHVLEVFTKQGFTVKHYEKIDIKSLFPVQIDDIKRNIYALRNTRDVNATGARTSQVEDLYSFAAYLNNDMENVEAYRAKPRGELLDIFDKASMKYSRSRDDLGKFCGGIAAAAKTYVFDSDEHQGKYEFYLKYTSPDVSKIFSSMHGVPKQMLEQEDFARGIIKTIASKLDCEFETALNIYNYEGGITVEPSTHVYLVNCSICGTQNEYRDEQEAMEKNSCSNCKKPLFKKCDKCGEMVRISLDRCPYPSCGYVFASAKLFEKYYAAAESALQNNNFDLARKNLLDAKSANSSEKLRVQQLTSKINEAEKRLKEPVNRLNSLITAGKYTAAQRELAQIIREYPELNVDDIKARIETALAKADAAYRSAQRLTKSAQADACVEILRSCVDHQPSIEFLRATPPSPVSDLTASANHAEGCINLTWRISGERSVKYYLVRKSGNSPAVSISDGKVLQQGSDNSYCDTSATPGAVFTYSIFASRRGVLSGAESKSVLLCSEVQNLRAVQSDKAVRLTWDLPQNSMGVTLTRSSQGKEVVLTRSAYSSYEDSEVNYGVAYIYRLSVNYPNQNSSPGLEVTFTPTVTISSFRMAASRVKDNIYKISWDIKQPNIDLRVMVDGRLAGECTSGAGSVQVNLPGETFSTITLMANSGGKWIASENSVQVNTYTSVSIDKGSSEIGENTVTTSRGVVNNVQIKIRMASGMPSNVAGFYYAVRTSASDKKWASVDEIGKACDINRISFGEYKASGGIVYSTTVGDERSFYVTVFTIYDVGGRLIISEPKMAKIDRIISANLFWKVSKKFLGRPELTISVEGNRPLERIPELLLCGCNEREFLLTPDDHRAVKLAHINSVELDKPQRNYTQVYDLGNDNCRNMKLFLFELNPIRSEKFAIRWLQGFSGKL